jgi:serine/threonine protein phosphatase 1
MRWIIGDVHGMLRPLEALINEVNRTDPLAVLYFVGDYVNRGPDSRGVIDLLLNMENAKFIRGNHDDVLDQILSGSAYAQDPALPDRFAVFQWFLEHGLLETLQSYGATADQIGRIISERSRDALKAVINLFPFEHQLFIHSLPTYIEDDDLFVIHGKWPVRQKSGPKSLLNGGIPPAQLRHEVLWGRYTDAELHRPKHWPKTGFFGHTPVATYRGHGADFCPIIASKMVLLDTAVALTPAGRLTAVCAETSRQIQTDPTGKVSEPATTTTAA